MEQIGDTAMVSLQNENDEILTAEHQKEKEELYKKFIALENQLNARQALEVEIEHMRQAVGAKKRKRNDLDQEMQRKMQKLEKKLKEKREELEYEKSKIGTRTRFKGCIKVPSRSCSNWFRCLEDDRTVHRNQLNPPKQRGRMSYEDDEKLKRLRNECGDGP